MSDAGPRQLLVDVSVIQRNDARTGIQRVVRALWLQLLARPPQGYVIRPVFATRDRGFHYVQGDEPHQAAVGAVRISAGDIFLGLDLSAHLLPRHAAELASWKRQGASLHFVVYDLIPVLNPHWFMRKTVRNFRKWLRVIAALSDSFICISNTVRAELAMWLADRHALAPHQIPIHTIPLGSDIAESGPSLGVPDGFAPLHDAIRQRRSVMMVGTIEPRKGHCQVVEAFDIIWRQKYDINLVIVGKPGWKTDALQSRIRQHPEFNRRLFWRDDVTDEVLTGLYETTDGVIIASEAEGFGLPLIEALHHETPVLARDIPVFREIGGGQVAYFEGTNAECLAPRIVGWLDEGRDMPRAADRNSLPTWKDGAQSLVSWLGEYSRMTQ